MKVKLNLMERFLVLQLLPKENNFATLKIVRLLQERLSPSEDEFKEFEVKQEGEKITWNIKGNEEREIEIGAKAHDMICDALKDLDKDKKLALSHISIYDKFVEDGKEDDKDNS